MKPLTGLSRASLCLLFLLRLDFFFMRFSCGRRVTRRRAFQLQPEARFLHRQACDVSAPREPAKQLQYRGDLRGVALRCGPGGFHGIHLLARHRRAKQKFLVAQCRSNSLAQLGERHFVAACGELGEDGLLLFGERGQAGFRDEDGEALGAAGVALEGGSFGFQIGAEATDFVLLVMNESGSRSVLSSKVKLGGDASVAAGPVGRDASAETDIVLNAQILSYSRAKGIFAGVSLEGSTVRSDDGANRALYGKDLSARDIVREGKVAAPGSAHELLSILRNASPRHIVK